jgi:peroxiredoxin family protein
MAQSTIPSVPAGPDLQKRNAIAIIVYGSTFDKAMMPMIIAQGALASGMEVSIFYTFFGLPALKRSFKPKMPGMWRMFTGMMEKKMQKQGIPLYRQMMRDNIEMGAKIYACNTSMELMGYKKEDLIDGCSPAGVAGFLDMAATATAQLAIG